MLNKKQKTWNYCNYYNWRFLSKNIMNWLYNFPEIIIVTTRARFSIECLCIPSFLSFFTAVFHHLAWRCVENWKLFFEWKKKTVKYTRKILNTEEVLLLLFRRFCRNEEENIKQKQREPMQGFGRLVKAYESSELFMWFFGEFIEVSNANFTEIFMRAVLLLGVAIYLWCSMF